MGRRAKYLTDAERRIAFQSHKQAYSQSPHARELRSIQNRVAYQCKHSRRSKQRLLPLQTPLPPKLISLANLPLPEDSYFFQEALASADNLDESSLEMWDKEPPYKPQASGNLDVSLFTEHLSEVMHGRRLRQQRECDTKRKQCYESRPIEELKNVIRRERDDVQCQWEALDDFLHDYHGGLQEVTMAEHLLQWHTRTVFHLDSQLQSLSYPR